MRDIYSERNVLVIGMGKSGSAAALYLRRRGAVVTAVDNEEILVRCRSEGMLTMAETAPLPDNIDLVVVSPGIPSDHHLLIEACRLSIPVIGEVELALREMKAPAVIGITGSNGKTTVTLMVTHILNGAGIKAHALGNVGEPLIQYVMNGYSGVAVVELSSYQLETLETHAFDAAIILNITANHLDRYNTINDYAAAKLRIGACMKETGTLFAFEEVVKRYGSGASRMRVTEEGEVFVDENVEYIVPVEYRMKARHEKENIAAAFVLCNALGVSEEQFLRGLMTFVKPAHRIEFVREVGGVEYYDDSKATSIAAVISAVESMTGSVILIAGGRDKKSPFLMWREAFERKVKNIIAIGEAAVIIADAVGDIIPVTIAATMGDAVVAAATLSERGDRVLLSPGCASFDMFDDYVHRGNVFKNYVLDL